MKLSKERIHRSTTCSYKGKHWQYNRKEIWNAEKCDRGPGGSVFYEHIEREKSVTGYRNAHNEK